MCVPVLFLGIIIIPTVWLTKRLLFQDKRLLWPQTFNIHSWHEWGEKQSCSLPRVGGGAQPERVNEVAMPTTKDNKEEHNRSWWWCPIAIWPFPPITGCLPSHPGQCETTSRSDYVTADNFQRDVHTEAFCISGRACENAKWLNL